MGKCFLQSCQRLRELYLLRFIHPYLKLYDRAISPPYRMQKILGESLNEGPQSLPGIWNEVKNQKKNWLGNNTDF